MAPSPDRLSPHGPCSRLCPVIISMPVFNVPGVLQNASRTTRAHNAYICTRTEIVQRRRLLVCPHKHRSLFARHTHSPPGKSCPSRVGLDVLSRSTSFLLSSLMWNLRPHPGQCLKNSISETLCNHHGEATKYQASRFQAVSYYVMAYLLTAMMGVSLPGLPTTLAYAAKKAEPAPELSVPV